MKSSRFRKLSIFTLITSIPLGAFAQSSILVDWNHNWNYHHPSNGALAAGSGTTAPHPDGTTPWFADAFSFAANYSGPSFTTGGADFDAGSGPGPLGYGTINYFTDPNPAPAEFTAFGTTIPDPGSGTRLTSYFRTTFNVPNDGNFYLNPSIQYLLDDGAFVYLDGELILEVNVDTADEYSANAITSAQTENILSSADLSLPAGSATGINAITIKSIDRLTPGTHTIAVSLHNHTDVSTDLAMAFQLVTEVTDCIITGSAGPSSRDFMGTPANPAGDTINAEITVAAEGVVSPNWTIVGPAGSSLLGLTGAYDTPLILANIPVAEFANGTITIEIADSANSSCTTNIDLAPLRIIGTNSLTATPSPIITSGSIDSPGWVFDENTRSLEMSDPGGTVPFDVASEDIDLTGQPDVQFTGTLTVEDLSTGSRQMAYSMALNSQAVVALSS